MINNFRYTLFLFAISLSISCLQAQDGIKQVVLLNDINIQIDASSALDDMYNFKFEAAEVKYNQIRENYPWHPLPYFLLGLSEWWKIMPNPNNESFDESFLAYMDTTIAICENLLKKRKEYEVEASFFLSSCYGFIGRLESMEERKNWTKSAFAGKKALKYLEKSKGQEGLSPELLFGDAIFNYFSVWVSENYTILRPIVAMFPDGDKELGLKQLTEVATTAFYTRVEANVFLMMILNSYENNRPRALVIGELLNKSYPDNPYFHRYYARLLYSNGKYAKCEKESLEILQRVDSGMVGYEHNSGRYAGFFLGQVYQSQKKDGKAKQYYGEAIKHAEALKMYESGYYLYSLLHYGKLLKKEGEKKEAREFFKKVKKYASRSHRAHKEARKEL